MKQHLRTILPIIGVLILIACENGNKYIEIEAANRAKNQMHTKLTTIATQACGPLSMRISKSNTYSLDPLEGDSEMSDATGSEYNGIVFDIIKPNDFTKDIEFTQPATSAPETFMKIYSVKSDGSYENVTQDSEIESIGFSRPTTPFTWIKISTTYSEDSYLFTDNQFTASYPYLAFLISSPFAQAINKEQFIGSSFVIKFQYPVGLRWDGGSCEVSVPDIKFKIVQ